MPLTLNSAWRDLLMGAVECANPSAFGVSEHGTLAFKMICID